MSLKRPTKVEKPRWFIFQMRDAWSGSRTYCPAFSSVNSVSKSGVKIRSHEAKRQRLQRKTTILKSFLGVMTSIASTFSSICLLITVGPHIRRL